MSDTNLHDVVLVEFGQTKSLNLPHGERYWRTIRVHQASGHKHDIVLYASDTTALDIEEGGTND